MKQLPKQVIVFVVLIVVAGLAIWLSSINWGGGVSGDTDRAHNENYKKLKQKIEAYKSGAKWNNTEFSALRDRIKRQASSQGGKLIDVEEKQQLTKLLTVNHLKLLKDTVEQVAKNSARRNDMAPFRTTVKRYETQLEYTTSLKPAVDILTDFNKALNAYYGTVNYTNKEPYDANRKAYFTGRLEEASVMTYISENELIQEMVTKALERLGVHANFAGTLDDAEDEFLLSGDGFCKQYDGYTYYRTQCDSLYNVWQEEQQAKKDQVAPGNP